MAPDPDQARAQLTAALEGQTLEQLLARVVVELDSANRYLGGIYAILREQEGLAAGLGDLAPMVMAMVTGAAGPQPRTVIEGERVG